MRAVAKASDIQKTTTLSILNSHCMCNSWLENQHPWRHRRICGAYLVYGRAAAENNDNMAFLIRNHNLSPSTYLFRKIVRDISRMQGLQNGILTGNLSSDRRSLPRFSEGTCGSGSRLHSILGSICSAEINPCWERHWYAHILMHSASWSLHLARIESTPSNSLFSVPNTALVLMQKPVSYHRSRNHLLICDTNNETSI